jgi:hypothetical protein
MLETFFEFIALSIIEFLLKPLFRFLKLPIVDETFMILVKILAILLVCLIIWTTYHFIYKTIH